MTDNAIRDALEALLQDEHAGELESQSIEQLSRSERGRFALAVWRWLSGGASTTTPQVDLAADVLADLPPDGGPRTWARLAELVLEGWADPGYRAALRRDPWSALAARGLRLDASLRLEIVAPEAAGLPDGLRVQLPLPSSARPAVPVAQAMRELDGTEFAWLFGPPWARSAPSEPAARQAPAPGKAIASAAGFGAGLLEGWWASRFGRQLVFTLGSVAILAFGLVYLAGHLRYGSDDMSGSAVGIEGDSGVAPGDEPVAPEQPKEDPGIKGEEPAPGGERPGGEEPGSAASQGAQSQGAQTLEEALALHKDSERLNVEILTEDCGSAQCTEELQQLVAYIESGCGDGCSPALERFLADLTSAQKQSGIVPATYPSKRDLVSILDAALGAPPEDG